MARYIEADKLLREYQEKICFGVECKLCPFCDTEELTCMLDNWISEQPTADVAEVVHCKDCKHFNPNEPCVGGTYEACTALSGADGCGMNVEEDFFCAYGEKI